MRLGKVFALMWGLFLCFGHAVAEEKSRVLHYQNGQLYERIPDRVVDLPKGVVAWRDPVATVRCARGDYSFDCRALSSAMTKPVELPKNYYDPRHCRSFITPGWRCE